MSDDNAVPDPGMTTPADLNSERGPIRNTLESFGMAVLLAVLLKYFFLEAYVIPTPSMQPTMMGSPKAGESDRILVDKSYYLFHEPDRWDIAVFRYPVRKIQSYVKRIVGVGGDRLRIAGGNLYQVSADGAQLTVLRKPERIQGTLWREIYPMRRKLLEYEASDSADVDAVPSKDEVFGKFFRSMRAWDIDPDTGDFVGTPSRSGKLKLAYLADEPRNNNSDGYDLPVARVARDESEGIIDPTQPSQLSAREKGDRGGAGQAVTDLRLSFDLTPKTAVDAMTIAIKVQSLGITYALEVKEGKGNLVATDTKPGPGQSIRSDPFDFAIPVGETTPIQFARLDDMLYAWREGEEVQRLDVSSIPIRQRLDFKTVGLTADFVTKERCTLANVRVERDLHYTLSQLPADHVIAVPEDHFFMMGDNTLGSADGRDWTAIRIGVDKDGNIVDPETHKDARILWGNKRTKPFDSGQPPHDDDNPVPLRDGHVVFVDSLGQFHNLKAKVDQEEWGRTNEVRFLGENNSWIAKEEKYSFVPREHIEGRPVARFLRSLPWKTVGWIR